ncbi:hypothetical protein [[Clostridium] polysaccharolyticum]|uniref:HTH cro/C1-type domain-containing protein n=1 Tax=[Clostridium] polysaccharolyticum TaxID=29364 RepID=A0A1H9YK01_9FIRM|nr:hypothetical protein [[Clostridium] polysaccharolyticum]SES69394.1 hypothetical protein SAMN04487772_10261 [[Clostridium] polysaccharolyticum]
MPKIKLSEQEEKDRRARACIAKNMELNGLNDESVAIKLHVTKRTFQNKKKRPGTFTLAELRKLSEVFKLSDEDKLQLI